MTNEWNTKELGTLAAKIEQLADELQVKLKLGEMEAKDLWDQSAKPLLHEAATSLKQLSDKLDRKEDETALQLYLGLKEADLRWGNLREPLENFVQHTLAKTEEKIDVARLKGHLGQMEFADSLQKKRKEWQSGFAKIESESAAQAKKIADEIGREVESLGEKLGKII